MTTQFGLVNTATEILTTADEGAGNGLDADTVDGNHASDFATAGHSHAAGDATTLDGLDSTQFLRSDLNDSTTGTLTIEPDAGNVLSLKGGTSDHVYLSLYPDASAQSTRNAYIGFGGAADETLTVENEYGNGDLALTASGTGDVLAGGSRVLTVADEGPGNGLDADLLDGQEGSYYLDRANHTGTNDADTLDSLDSTQFLRSDVADTATGLITFEGGLHVDVADASNPFEVSRLGSSTNELVAWTFADTETLVEYTNDDASGLFRLRVDNTDTDAGIGLNANNAELRLYSDGTVSYVELYRNGSLHGTLWHSGNDGASSGLDADLLDGQQGTHYLTRSNHTGTQTASTISDFAEATSDQVGTMVTGNTESGITVTYQDADNTLDFSVTDSPLLQGNNSAYHLARANHTGTQTLSTISDSGDLAALDTVSTSDIDDNAVSLAKLADIATDSFIGRDTAGTGNPEVLSASTARSILNVENGATADQTAADIRGLGFFDTTNDGSGSGLDADTVDGSHASAFATSGHNHDSDYVELSGDTLTGFLTLHADPTSNLHAATKKYVDDNAGDIGRYTTTSSLGTTTTVTHNLGTYEVAVTVYDTSTRKDILVTAERTSTNAVDVHFGESVAAGDYTIVVMG